MQLCGVFADQVTNDNNRYIATNGVMIIIINVGGDNIAMSGDDS